MPLLSGAELVRIVRSAGVFPIPDVPIIMLSAHGERWRVVEAVKLGVNEYLVKPLSAKALYDRRLSITMQPRPRCSSATIAVPSRVSSPARESRRWPARPHLRCGDRTLTPCACSEQSALARIECQIYDSTNWTWRRTVFASPTRSAGVGD